LVGLRNERLPPGEPVSMVFDVPGGRAGVLEATLDVPGDHLPADDRAWALLGAAAARDVVLVGGDALTARVLAADPRVVLKRLRPAEATLEALAGADAVFFLDGVPPKGADGLNMALLSRKVAGPATLGELRPMPEIVSWERTHPILRFVDFSGATIARAASVGDLGGLTPLVDADAGPLLLAGDRAGGRVLQATFDPYETDLPMRVAWPVLLLNAVGWLTERSGTGGEAAILPAGTPWVRTVPGASAVSATGPAGKVDVDVLDGVLRVVDTERIGVYRVAVDGSDHSFVANLLSEGESRIQPAAALAIDAGSPVTAEAGVRPGRRELWRPLLALGMFLMLLEWWAWNRRKTA
ncbi:MAG: hypothetical protein KC656_15450, partial [Myxococcales bacterium]|nr:hypothetical protein [Myxococcales bacterium]